MWREELAEKGFEIGVIGSKKSRTISGAGKLVTQLTRLWSRSSNSVLDSLSHDRP